MNKNLLAGAAFVAALSLPVVANAQNGAAAGATTGAVTGAVVGGPVGAAVGAGVGAVAGGIADDTRPRFRTYVQERRVPSYRYEREVRVGEDLPSNGVTYYDVPREYGVTKYRVLFWSILPHIESFRSSTKRRMETAPLRRGRFRLRRRPTCPCCSSSKWPRQIEAIAVAL